MCLMPAHTYGSQHRRERPTQRTTAGRVAVLLLLAPGIGMFFGGTVFVVLCTAAAALAALRVRSAGLWWVVPVAPMVIWAVCVSVALMGSGGGGKEDDAIALVHGMIDAFPAILFALAGMAAVIVMKRLAARRRRLSRG